MGRIGEGIRARAVAQKPRARAAAGCPARRTAARCETGSTRRNAGSTRSRSGRAARALATRGASVVVLGCRRTRLSQSHRYAEQQRALNSDPGCELPHRHDIGFLCVRSRVAEPAEEQARNAQEDGQPRRNRSPKKPQTKNFVAKRKFLKGSLRANEAVRAASDQRWLTDEPKASDAVIRGRQRRTSSGEVTLDQQRRERTQGVRRRQLAVAGRFETRT